MLLAGVAVPGSAEAGSSGGTVAIAAGIEHTCAVTASGGVKCWGWNDAGQLGDGTLTDSTTPIDVYGLIDGVAAITVGAKHTCALTTVGGVKCWGYNAYGQLGDGTHRTRRKPVDVVGLTSGVTAISAGYYHTCALTTSDTVKCWGFNRAGQLGADTNYRRLRPVDVMRLEDVAAISAGEVQTCALLISGGLKCWGNNHYGQLGDGTTKNRRRPVDVLGLTSGMSAISTGRTHTCAITDSVHVKCWGDNYEGQLGDGTRKPRLTPVDVVGLTDVTAASAGGLNSCAITGTGGVKCWGANHDGSKRHLTPVDMVGLTSGVSVVSAGWTHTCGLTTSGVAKCWGRNNAGQLGDGTTRRRTQPVDVSGL